MAMLSILSLLAQRGRKLPAGRCRPATSHKSESCQRLEQELVFTTGDRLETVLKQVAGPVVAEVECDRIAGEKARHHSPDGDLPEAKKQVEVIRHERPGNTISLRFDIK